MGVKILDIELGVVNARKKFPILYHCLLIIPNIPQSTQDKAHLQGCFF